MNERYYLLKIQLPGIEPAIWRRFAVPSSITLDRLHDVIQIVMGWTDSHLHEFTIGKNRLIDDINISRFKYKLKELTRKTTPIGFAERIRRLNRLITGWLNYFKLANIQGKLQALDSWLRKRLSYGIWHHWKRPERKRMNLMRLGVNPENAYAWNRTRMGGWRVAQSPILKTTITLARLKQRGYIAMLDTYHKIKSGNEPPYTRPVRTVV